MGDDRHRGRWHMAERILDAVQDWQQRTGDIAASLDRGTYRLAGNGVECRPGLARELVVGALGHVAFLGNRELQRRQRAGTGAQSPPWFPQVDMLPRRCR